MRKDQHSKLRKGSKPPLFIELAEPDDLGFSRPVSITEFEGKYESLKFGNGGDWIRKDGTLSRYYNIRRHFEGKGKITHVELQGFRKVPVPENRYLNISDSK